MHYLAILTFYCGQCLLKFEGCVKFEKLLHDFIKL